MKTIAIVNHKGGVGKTCSCINLANQIHGKSLVIDVDPQADASKALGIKEQEAEYSSALLFTQQKADLNSIIRPINTGLSIIPSSLELEMALTSLVGKFNYHLLLAKQLKKLTDYDYVFIDCPPSLSISTINGITAADGIISPIQADRLSIAGLGAIRQMIDDTESKAELRPLWTNYNKTHQRMNRIIEDELNWRVIDGKRVFKGQDALRHEALFDARISTDQTIPASMSEGVPITTFKPNAKAAADYQALSSEVRDWINNVRRRDNATWAE